MAQKSKPKNPFALFSAGHGLSDSDFSSDDEDGNSEKQEATNSDEPTFISKPESKGTDASETSLPAPDFDKVTKCSFVSGEIQKDLDWDKLTKDDTKEKEETSALSNTNAIPPPKTYEPQTDQLKPTLGATEIGSKRHSDAPPGDGRFFLSSSLYIIEHFIDLHFPWEMSQCDVTHVRRNQAQNPVMPAEPESSTQSHIGLTTSYRLDCCEADQKEEQKSLSHRIAANNFLSCLRFVGNADSKKIKT